MNARRTIAVAVMHARDLSRRRVALAILVALPLVFYAQAEFQPVDPQVEKLLSEDPVQQAASELWILSTAAIGAGWSIAIAALFITIGSRRADQPLQLAGFRPTELIVGRVVTVLALAAVITPVFAAIITTQRDVDLPLLLLSMSLSALVAVAIGVLAAGVVPMDMEGVLVIVGVIGVQMGDPLGWMPLWGPGQLLRQAAGLPATDTSSAVIHGLLYAAALFAVGTALWVRRMRLRAPQRVLSVPVGVATSG